MGTSCVCDPEQSPGSDVAVGARSCSSCAVADAPVRGGGAALRRLRIQQTWGGQVDNSVLDEYQLARLCAACPRLESLAVAGASAPQSLIPNP